MVLAVITIRLYASWVHSLKEKRMVVKSLLSKLSAKFNISVAEAADQELHQSIVLMIAGLAADSAQADSILENIQSFIELSTDAQILSVEREIR